jgi:hypothetical protein
MKTRLSSAGTLTHFSTVVIVFVAVFTVVVTFGGGGGGVGRGELIT